MTYAAIGIAVIACSCFLIADRRLRHRVAVWSPLLLIAVGPSALAELVDGNLVTLQKVGVIAAWAFALMALGHRLSRAMIAPSVGWLVAFIGTTALGVPLLGLTSSDSLIALGGYVFPFLAFAVRWETAGTHRVAYVIALLPCLSLALGLALQFAGAGSIFRDEFTGVPRLQAAMIPAHFAMLCVVATIAGCWLMAEQKRGAGLLTALALALCVLTSTRGAIAVAFFIYLVATTRTKSSPALQRVASLVVGAVVVVAGLPALLQRSSAVVGGDPFNTSGRLDAWQFWIRAAEVSPYFGRGVGASIELSGSGITQTRALENFVVPHNMYLQIWLDVGYVGGAAVAIGLLMAWRHVRRSAASSSQPFLRATGLAFLGYSLIDNTLVTPHMTVPLATLLAVIAHAGDRLPSGDEGKVGHGGGIVPASQRVASGKVGQARDRSRQTGRNRSLARYGSDQRVPRNLQRPT